MFKGFKNFLMQGDLIVVAVGLVVALAFSTLIKAFTDSVIKPLINALASSHGSPMGFHLRGQFIDVGSFLSALMYFIIFMAVVYVVLVVPYRRYMATKGRTVFGPPAASPPVKTCPQCLLSDVPEAATRCWHCASVLS